MRLLLEGEAANCCFTSVTLRWMPGGRGGGVGGGEQSHTKPTRRVAHCRLFRREKAVEPLYLFVFALLGRRLPRLLFPLTPDTVVSTWPARRLFGPSPSFLWHSCLFARRSHHLAFVSRPRAILLRMSLPAVFHPPLSALNSWPFLPRCFNFSRRSGSVAQHEPLSL